MGQAKQRKSEIDALKAQGSRVKELGQVFTPSTLVKEMLDTLDDAVFNLPVEQLKWKTFLEPSCGNGQFVLGVIRKLMDAYAPHWNKFSKNKNGWELVALTHILEVQLFAVELDPVQHEQCISRVRDMIRSYGQERLANTDFNHNIICGNTLELNLDVAFFEHMKTWKQAFIAKTAMHVQAAYKYKLRAIAMDTEFNPADMQFLNMMLKRAA